MKFLIEYKNSRWLVNGKRYEELNLDERQFMDDFFREFKAKIELHDILKKNKIVANYGN